MNGFGVIIASIIGGLALAAAGFFGVQKLISFTSTRLPSTTPTQGRGVGPPFRPAPSPSKPKLGLQDAVRAMAEAIAKFETGFRGSRFPVDDPAQWHLPGGTSSVAARNFNPGNLRWIGQGTSVGVGERGYARFPSPQVGWVALLSDIRAKITGRTRTALGPNSTLAEFVAVYAPATENPTAEYIAFVSSQLSVNSQERFRDWVLV